MTAPSTDLPLSQFRMITIHMENGSSTTHVVHVDEVEALQNATLELHYLPGVNPHTGGKTTAVTEIWAMEMMPSGPFWWSTPGLGKTKGTKGATLFTDQRPRLLWRHPEQQRLLDEEDARVNEAISRAA